MKVTLGSFLIGFFTAAFPAALLTECNQVAIESRNFEKHAKVKVLTDSNTFKKDTFVILPLHSSDLFNRQVSRKIENGDVKVTQYKGPKF